MGKLLPLVVLALVVYAMVVREPDKTQHRPRLDPLATASLVPGRGLGDLVLGETTLGEIVQKYGVEKTASVHGDFTAIELTYAATQLRLQFQLSNKLAYSLDPPLRAMHRDPENYIYAHPRVRDLRLHSLSVRGPRHDRTAAFYAGDLEGLQLGADEQAVLAWARVESLRELSGAPGALHAGTSNDGPSITLWIRKRGVVFEMERERIDETTTRVSLRRITLVAPSVEAEKK